MKKRFIYTLLATLITAAVLDGIFFVALSSGLRKVHKDFEGKLNYIISGKDHYDVVFMGSSRVHNGINPLLFDSLTKVNSYNAGMEGARIAEDAVFMKKFIKSHEAPRYIIFSIEETLLRTGFIWDFPRFFPYTSDPDVFKLYTYQYEILFSRYLPPLALTYYDDPRKSLGLQGLIIPAGEYAWAKTKGYQALPVLPPAELKPVSEEYYQYTDDGWAILENICKSCAAKGIKLIFVVPPKLIERNLVGATAPSFERFSALAGAYHIPVFDMSHKNEFTNPHLFYDGIHLNPQGADLYTALIAEQFNALH